MLRTEDYVEFFQAKKKRRKKDMMGQGIPRKENVTSKGTAIILHTTIQSFLNNKKR